MNFYEKMPAIRAAGFTSGFDVFLFTLEGHAAIQPGKNLIAIHCHQTTGGQYVDLGFVEIKLAN
jgi:hypothetical protein